MIDMHCHLDLYKNPIALLPEVQRRCKFVLAVTTSPRAWQKTKQVFAGIDCIQVALGLHPEILSSKMNEIDMLLSNIRYCKYIGEVGIDGSEQYKSSFLTQKDLFREVALTAEKCGGKIISIHSRNAAKDVLDIIESNMATSIPILHWFSGTMEEVQRANALGCWFSVSPAMLSSKKGKNLVSKMPLSRILPETDAPFTEKRGAPYMPWEASDVIDTLKEIFQLNATQIENEFNSNVKRIIDQR
ncbi:TatD DNase family protein [Tissierella praeacuta]|uniref:Qat anti-phage system TatD family nuclease QatD n=1 Tax=Tissierella praeacuta TaxID=43131 RepID=UPI001048FDB1|nr:Qat anti-phage system TatD family nuclease QatD [Tissierella praeacuta]TCU79431.1 TatD DNase family protein [Tissierella praeacuta]